WVEAANLSRYLSYHLPVRAFDRQLGVFLNGHFDLRRDGIYDWVRIPETEIHGITLDRRFESDALDFELFAKAFAHAANHVIDQCAAQTVQRLCLGVVALTADDHFSIVHLKAGAAGQLPIEFAFRPLDGDLLAFYFNLHLGRNGNRLFSNT